MMDLSDFLRSDHWQAWGSDNRSAGSAGMVLSDPERFNRIEDAAENGCDGSTHGEVIQDWRDALECYTDLSEDETDSIAQEIDECEQWHVSNGSIDQTGG